MRQMVGAGIFETKAGSKERGKTWMEIAEVLNTDERFCGALTARGARDRFTLISRRQKAKNTSQVRSTGGGGEERSEFDVLVEDLIELNEESEKKAQEKMESQKEKEKQEREKALDMRQKAMETMGQTKKRVSEDRDEVDNTKKIRRSRGDAMTWIDKKAELDAEWRKVQLEDSKAEREMAREERRQDREMQRMQLEVQIKAHQDQQAQQARMMQQMMAMFQQQQQQMQSLFLSRPGN